MSWRLLPTRVSALSLAARLLLIWSLTLLANRVRRHNSEPLGQHRPMIAVSANALQGAAQRCPASGMDDDLSKPLWIRKLGAMLARWLLQASPLATPSKALISRATSALYIRARDIFFLQIQQLAGELFIAEARVQQRLLTRFLAHAQQQCDAILAAAPQADFSTLLYQAHSLKSAARSVGARALGKLGKLCEQPAAASSSQDLPLCQRLVLVLRLLYALTEVQTRIDCHLAKTNALPGGA